jgi:DNA-binding YbaB/EbfC family protein
MKNLSELMKQAGQMQAKMADLQAQLDDLEIKGSSGAGMVVVTLNGKGVMLNVSIDDSLMKVEEKEVLEDLLTAAHNDAKAKAEVRVEEETKKLMGGLELPPGMKLPF